MNKRFLEFKYDQKVSSPLALVFLMILSFVVAKYCLALAKEITDNAKNSPGFNIQVRIEKNKLK